MRKKVEVGSSSLAFALVLLAMVLGVGIPRVVSAQNYTGSLIYSFSGGNDGATPYSALIQASDGNLYGTTRYGGGSSNCGAAGCGTVFRISNLTTTPTESVIYSFAGGADGNDPQAALIQASDGNLYGTTAGGGPGGCFGGCGTVFKISNLSTTPTESVIYSFTGGNDGATPAAALIQAADGSLYGSTFNSLGGFGTIFEMSNPTTNPTVSVIYPFTAVGDGYWPEAALIQASDGSLYGTTYYGGSSGYGTVFKISRLAPLSYCTIAPCRLIDTRSSSTAPYGGPALAGGSQKSFVAANHCGIPSGASALSGNVTVVGPQAKGDLRVFTSGQAISLSSTLNFNAEKTRANNVVTTIDSDGSMTIQCDMPAATSTNLLFDVNGYFK